VPKLPVVKSEVEGITDDKGKDTWGFTVPRGQRPDDSPNLTFGSWWAGSLSLQHHERSDRMTHSTLRSDPDERVRWVYSTASAATGWLTQFGSWWAGSLSLQYRERSDRMTHPTLRSDPDERVRWVYSTASAATG